MKANRFHVHCAAIFLLAGLVCGCKTTFRTVDERFKTNSAAYARVQVLPIWLEGAGNIDATLTTNDLQVLCREAGDNLSVTIGNALRAKGYIVVDTVKILPEDFAAWDAETRGELEGLRLDIFQNLAKGYSASIGEKPLTFTTNSAFSFGQHLKSPTAYEPSPFHYRTVEPLTNLLARMSATNSEAILLVDTKAFFESKHSRTKRAVWNWTGGGLVLVTEIGFNAAIIVAAALSGTSSMPAPGTMSAPIGFDPFWHSKNSLQHNMALVVARTGEVLWLNQQNFKRKNPRDDKDIEKTITEVMKDLPDL
jgi:hypothetical protein